MIIRGVGSHRNLKGQEKIHDGPSHGNVAHGHVNSGQVHILTVDGIEYFMCQADGVLEGNSFFNGINNKTIDVEGEFVAGIIVVTSWTKVGP
jgi:hypothetical protein